jgi:hypothetical protein
MQVSEAAGQISISLHISRAPDQAVAVRVVLDAVHSTGVNNQDFFFASPTTVNFPANSSSQQTITLMLYDDNIPEQTETIRLIVANPTGGAIASDTLLIKILDNDPNGITHTDRQASFRLFPNPVSGILNIDTEGLGGSAYHWQIIAPEGKLMLTGDSHQSLFDIDISTLHSGIYQLILSGQDGSNNIIKLFLVR